MILQRYAPAAVLVGEKGDILYTSGRTGKYLEPTAGKANWNIFAMVPAGLSNKLNRTFHQAISQNSILILKNVELDTDNDQQTVDITIQPLAEPRVLRRLVMIVFTDVRVPPPKKSPLRNMRLPFSQTRVAELEQELQESYRELRSVRQEMQSSQEELLSAYEELQSTNEELQSTSEETITSKEELQSLNEELQTVNYELQAKLDEVYLLNNDLKNLLESTDIAVLFLDNKLLLRRFTAKTAKIIKLRAGDVGRPITEIVSTLTYPKLAEDGQKVLRTLQFIEKTVSASEDRWFRVRIMPYRTLDDKIDGLVLTFTEVTASKTLEIAQLKTEGRLEKRIRNQNVELVESRAETQREVQRRGSAETVQSDAAQKEEDQYEQGQ